MGPDEQFLAIRDTELVENAGEMMSDGNAGNAQTVGNVFVGQSLTDQSDDFLFPLRESIEAFMLGRGACQEGGGSACALSFRGLPSLSKVRGTSSSALARWAIVAMSTAEGCTLSTIPSTPEANA